MMRSKSVSICVLPEMGVRTSEQWIPQQPGGTCLRRIGPYVRTWQQQHADIYDYCQAGCQDARHSGATDTCSIWLAVWHAVDVTSQIHPLDTANINRQRTLRMHSIQLAATGRRRYTENNANFDAVSSWYANFDEVQFFKTYKLIIFGTQNRLY